jgi:hypothetical protein
MASFASSFPVVLDIGFPFPCTKHIGMRLDDHETRGRNSGKWSKIASSLLKDCSFLDD